MNVLELFATLNLDSSEYDQGLSEAKNKASGWGDKLASAAKFGTSAIAAVGTATAAMTTAVIAQTGKVAEYGDNIDKMSQKMGMSAQAYQEWDAVMQHSGTSMETMKAGMKTLANAVENNNEAFQRLGMTQEQVASMSQEELFAATISGLQNVDSETERTYLAGQLLGRGATELGALLNTSAEETQAMKDRVHELGGVMSDDAVKASARYQDSLQDMQTAFGGLQRGMISKFLPAMSTVMDGLGNLFSGNGGLGQIKEGINQFAATLGEVLPKITEVGGQILVALGDAIVANLPVLIDAAVSLIMTLANGLIEQLPTLVQSGLQIILALAKGIASNLPTLIPTIVDVVLEIVDTLIDNVDMLVEAALQIIVALAEGLIKALPKLLAKAPEIIASLVGAIIGAVGQLAEAAGSIISTLASGIASRFSTIIGKGRELLQAFKSGVVSAVGSLASAGLNLVQGIWNGISSGLGWIKGKIQGWVGNVTSFIKSLFGIHSPSTVMRDQVGKFLALGIGEGFTREMTSVEKMMQNSMPDLTSNIDVNGNYNGYGYGSGAFGGMAINGDVYITVEGAGKNAEEIGRDLYKMLVRQGGVAYAY